MLLVNINWIQRKLLMWESMCVFMPKSLAGVHTVVEYDGERKNKTVMYKQDGSLGGLWKESSRKSFLPSSPHSSPGGDFHF